MADDKILLAGYVKQAIENLKKQMGVIGAFVYGSVLFQPLENCNDIDILVISISKIGLIWHPILLNQTSPFISATIVDFSNLQADLNHLKWAGYLLNKFINPISIVKGTVIIGQAQNKALQKVAATIGKTSLQAIIAWKDKQFPGWRRTHRDGIFMGASINVQNERKCDDLLLSPLERGHWDVYKSLKRGHQNIYRKGLK